MASCRGVLVATGAARTSFTGACLRSLSRSACRDQHASGSCGTYTYLNMARSPWVQSFAASAACSSCCCSWSPAAFLYTCILLRYFYDLLLALACLMFFDWHVVTSHRASAELQILKSLLQHYSNVSSRLHNCELGARCTVCIA